MVHINNMDLNDFIKSQIESGCEVVQSVRGVMSRNNERTEVINGSLTITRNNKTTTLSGRSIVNENGEWFVDGKKMEV